MYNLVSELAVFSANKKSIETNSDCLVPGQDNHRFQLTSPDFFPQTCSGKQQYSVPAPSPDMDLKLEQLKQITEYVNNNALESVPFILPSNSKVNYTYELNNRQLTAVTITDRPLLVIAGAGSGKTRVITYKVAWLIENGYSPDEILLLTFTKKAANEMLDRVSHLLADKKAGNVLGGTFHRFANYALRKYAAIIGIPANFSIIDPEDAADIIDLIKNEMKISSPQSNLPFPRKGRIQEIISRSKNIELPINEVIVSFFPDCKAFTSEIITLASALHEYKSTAALLDYDDLLIQLRHHLRSNEAFRNIIRQSVRYILVDEFQDTNMVQSDIVKLLSADQKNITVVGDDSQCIYSFRGAIYENILRFPTVFPDCAIVKLEENYRSNHHVLGLCNDVIEAAKIGFQKRLFTSNSSGPLPGIARFPDNQAEASFIADKIMELHANELDFSEFAVLTRASWHSSLVQIELEKRGIPFIVSGGIRFSERRHVRDMIALLKLVTNPRDAVAWNRSLKLIQGIGQVSASEIVKNIVYNNGVLDVSTYQKRKFFGGLQLLAQSLQNIAISDAGMNETIQLLLKYYLPVLQQVEDDLESRLRDLEIFAGYACRFDDVESFLSEFMLDPPSNSFQKQNGASSANEPKPVTVSTIHSAKGLEWNTVFIPYCLDGLFPSVKALKNIESIEEERRLFYVACTRAKENLFISMPAFVSSWDAFFTLPSRFIIDINSEHYSSKIT